MTPGRSIASVPLKKTPPILRPVLSFTASVASSAVPAVVADAALPAQFKVASVWCIFTPGRLISTEPLKSTPPIFLVVLSADDVAALPAQVQWV